MPRHLPTPPSESEPFYKHFLIHWSFERFQLHTWSCLIPFYGICNDYCTISSCLILWMLASQPPAGQKVLTANVPRAVNFMFRDVLGSTWQVSSHTVLSRANRSRTHPASCLPLLLYLALSIQKWKNFSNSVASRTHPHPEGLYTCTHPSRLCQSAPCCKSLSDCIITAKSQLIL
jgi:hypothetical protein